MDTATPYFEEQILLMNWVIVLVVAILVTIPAVFATWIRLRQWVPKWAVVVVVLFLCFVLFVMISTKLWVRVDERGIAYQYVPFHWSPRLMRWSDIEEAYCRVHYAEIEYGSWGVAGEKSDKAYTMPGVYGIQVVLRSGDRVLVSVSEPSKVGEVLRYYLRRERKYDTAFSASLTALGSERRSFSILRHYFVKRFTIL